MEINNSFNPNVNIDGDNNTVNITYNIVINIDQRGNLEDKQDGKTHEFTMFFIKEVDNLKKKGYKYALCTNVYSGHMFLSDHVHVRFNENMICDWFNHKLLNVEGKVYKYKRKDGTFDYAINVDKIANVSERLFTNDYKLFKGDITNINKFDSLIDNIPNDILYDIVQQQINTIDIPSMMNKDLCPGFLSGIILTRYFLNTQLKALVNQQSVLRNAKRECLIDVLKMLSYIMYKIDDYTFFEWIDVLKGINEVCNYLQGMNLNHNNRKKRKYIQHKKDLNEETFKKNVKERITTNG